MPSRPAAGIAATAEAVSCEPTATTVVPAARPTVDASARQERAERGSRVDDRLAEESPGKAEPLDQTVAQSRRTGS
jgi:hypothetical protein